MSRQPGGHIGQASAEPVQQGHEVPVPAPGVNLGHRQLRPSREIGKLGEERVEKCRHMRGAGQQVAMGIVMQVVAHDPEERER